MIDVKKKNDFNVVTAIENIQDGTLGFTSTIRNTIQSN